MGQKDMERSGISEVIRGKLYFAVLHRAEDLKASWLPGPAICFSVDNELVYEPFYADFGPLNLACTYHFCMKVSGILQEGEMHGRCVCFCCSSESKKKPNAAVLLGAYLVLFEGWDVEAAYAPLAEFEPYLPFRDPTCGISTYHLSVLDCIRAVAKGKKIGWIDFRTFNVKEYEYFEQIYSCDVLGWIYYFQRLDSQMVENGDLNWIVPNKIVAFSGPGARRTEVCGYRTLIPEDYVEYFKQSNICTVIRLNKRLYDKRRFTEHGISHHDLYFPDGSCPPERIVQRFLEILEDSTGAVAVHCKAGLGRTGVLIGCFLMKNFRFTANEAIGYLRILRPGSVIGPQQHFLRDMQSRMWKAGDLHRRQRSELTRNNRLYAGPQNQENNTAAQDASSSISSPLASLSLQRNPQGWAPVKGGPGGFRGQPVSQDTKRVNPREIEYSNNSGNRNASSSTMNTGLPYKEPREQPEMEVSSEYRRSYNQDGIQSRPNVCQRRPSVSRGSNGMCPPTIDNSMEQNRRPSSGVDPSVRSNYSMRTRPSPIQPVTAAAIHGIMSNKEMIKPQTSEAVCTQRVLNAAGQPRKVVVPVSQMATKDSSPRRRRSGSPMRYQG